MLDLCWLESMFAGQVGLPGDQQLHGTAPDSRTQQGQSMTLCCPGHQYLEAYKVIRFDQR